MKTDIPRYIDNQTKVSVKLMGNICEVSISDRQGKATICPVSDEAYVVLSTGELKSFSCHADNRTENRRNLEKTMKHLSDIINVNINLENIPCCRFFTLTYQKNQRDPHKVYHDFKNFNQKFKRHVNKLGLKYEYIFVLEAQARGAFHGHCIFIFNAIPPFFDSSMVSTIWGQGFVSIEALKGNPDDIGRYLTAYLTDLPVDEICDSSNLSFLEETKEIQATGKDKRILKRARLSLIPAGTRIFRCSRGIKRPVIIKAPYGEALEHLAENGYQKTREIAYELYDSESDFKSKYVMQTYKKYINPKMNKRKEQVQ